MIPRLPYWVLTEKQPAFSETESRTAVEMVARVYGKIQELIDDYNSFVDTVNENIEDFESTTNQDLETFKTNLEKIIHDYIATLDMKIAHMERSMQEATSAMTTNLKDTVEQVVEDMKANGDFDTVIANAFDSLGGRVITLENSYLDVDSRLDTLEESKIEVETRLANLESSTVKLIYNSENESLNFENMEVEIV